MKYFVMDKSYGWKSVDKSIYDSPSDFGMIENKACIDSEAFVTISIAKVDMGSVFDLLKLLSFTWKER